MTTKKKIFNFFWINEIRFLYQANLWSYREPKKPFCSGQDMLVVWSVNVDLSASLNSAPKTTQYGMCSCRRLPVCLYHKYCVKSGNHPSFESRNIKSVTFLLNLKWLHSFVNSNSMSSWFWHLFLGLEHVLPQIVARQLPISNWENVMALHIFWNKMAGHNCTGEDILRLLDPVRWTVYPPPENENFPFNLEFRFD